MNKIHLLISALTLSLILTGCGLEKAGKESVEAIQNIQSEALKIKTGVETSVTQFKEAKDSVENAVGAVQDAKKEIEDLKP